MACLLFVPVLLLPWHLASLTTMRLRLCTDGQYKTYTEPLEITDILISWTLSEKVFALFRDRKGNLVASRGSFVSFPVSLIVPQFPFPSP
ncbi:hypothetical protein BofuT4_uP110710.1 [Botrytis cinerea T4]|uniref:Secreted protein n=1 Tax=Botryotinia fuckeliana (strain T4) TaxID=999810 RepID=G2Y606_BOTF4|nr:hypothetical protein BofuT4_uP110710.1 [Botrytis cinerea T4]